MRMCAWQPSNAATERHGCGVMVGREEQHFTRRLRQGGGPRVIEPLTPQKIDTCLTAPLNAGLREASDIRRTAGLEGQSRRRLKWGAAAAMGQKAKMHPQPCNNDGIRDKLELGNAWLAMAKNGPSARRMGFGYRAALEAGVPYVPMMSKSAQNLRSFLKKHPDLSARAEQELKAGKTPYSILKKLREEGAEGRFCISVWRGPSSSDWVHTTYSPDKRPLLDEAERGRKLGIYQYAWLWTLDIDTGEWELEELPWE